MPFLRKNSKLLRRYISIAIIFVFLSTTILPSYAQAVFTLPAPGTMVNPSPSFIPVLLKGMVIHPENPLHFDFIVDSGNTQFTADQIKEESMRLVKYFLAAMTVPGSDLWVNLSPYEEDRMIPDALGQTVLGLDMLAQDYILKQLTASLIHPESDLGQAFWQRVYAKAYEQYGTTTIPLDTFNKIWIVPEEATVFEHGQAVYIIKSKLKVLMEEDYLAKQVNSEKHLVSSKQNQKPDTLHPSLDTVSSQIVREIVLPEIEHEVNHGKNFAPMRQIYQSLILSQWYKETIKQSLLSQVYVDQKKIKGVDLSDPSIKDQIYARYVESFKKGVFDLIRVEHDQTAQKFVPRKYFSGGLDEFGNIPIKRDDAIGSASSSAQGDFSKLSVRIEPAEDSLSKEENKEAVISPLPDIMLSFDRIEVPIEDKSRINQIKKKQPLMADVKILADQLKEKGINKLLFLSGDGGAIKESRADLLRVIESVGIENTWYFLNKGKSFKDGSLTLEKHLDFPFAGFPSQHGQKGLFPNKKLEAKFYEAMRQAVEDLVEKEGGSLDKYKVVFLDDLFALALVPFLKQKNPELKFVSIIRRDISDATDKAKQFLSKQLNESTMITFWHENLSPGKESVRISGDNRIPTFVLDHGIFPYSSKNDVSLVKEKSFKELFEKYNFEDFGIQDKEDMEKINKEGDFILQIGRFRSAKAHLVSLLAYSIATDEWKREGLAEDQWPRLILLGPAPKGGEVNTVKALKSVTEKLGLQKHVITLVLNQEAKQNNLFINFLQKKAKFAVHPSRTDAFSLVVLEMSHKGLPVIASNVGGLEGQILPHLTIDFSPQEREYIRQAYTEDTKGLDGLSHGDGSLLDKPLKMNIVKSLGKKMGEYFLEEHQIQKDKKAVKTMINDKYLVYHEVIQMFLMLLWSGTDQSIGADHPVKLREVARQWKLSDKKDMDSIDRIFNEILRIQGPSASSIVHDLAMISMPTAWHLKRLNSKNLDRRLKSIQVLRRKNDPRAIGAVKVFDDLMDRIPESTSKENPYKKEMKAAEFLPQARQLREEGFDFEVEHQKEEYDVKNQPAGTFIDPKGLYSQAHAGYPSHFYNELGDGTGWVAEGMMQRIVTTLEKINIVQGRVLKEIQDEKDTELIEAQKDPQGIDSENKDQGDNRISSAPSKTVITKTIMEEELDRYLSDGWNWDGKLLPGLPTGQPSDYAYGEVDYYEANVWKETEDVKSKTKKDPDTSSNQAKDPGSQMDLLSEDEQKDSHGDKAMAPGGIDMNEWTEDTTMTPSSVVREPESASDYGQLREWISGAEPWLDWYSHYNPDDPDASYGAYVLYSNDKQRVEGFMLFKYLWGDYSKSDIYIEWMENAPWNRGKDREAKGVATEMLRKLLEDHPGIVSAHDNFGFLTHLGFKPDVDGQVRIYPEDAIRFLKQQIKRSEEGGSLVPTTQKTFDAIKKYEALLKKNTNKGDAEKTEIKNDPKTFSGQPKDPRSQKDPLSEDEQNDSHADKAMAPGGIDMNEIFVDRQGALSIDIQLNSALIQDILQNGVDGFVPVIINLTPINSILPLLGLGPEDEFGPADKQEDLAYYLN